MVTRSHDDLAVVIVAYGPEDSLKRCLDALGPGLSVIVVDNGTSAAARGVVEQAGARYVDPGRNLGFAAGVNLALSLVADDPLVQRVLLVNPDAEVEPDAIDLLLGAMDDDDRLAAVGPALLDPTASHPIRGSWPFPSPGWAWSDALGRGDRKPRPEFVAGAVLLLSVPALQQIGNLDERYFLYCEESDWQKRAVDAGWRVRVLPDAVATHVQRGTGGDPLWREASFVASVERYMRKWYGSKGWLSFRVAAGLAAARRLLQHDPVRRAAARRRVELYLRGPERVALQRGVPLPPIASVAAPDRSPGGIRSGSA